MTPPILFLTFNRPDTTSLVFEAIRAARPAKLYVAADGPRADRAGEAERCAEVRRIATEVDWPCQVSTLFREQNLGCDMAVPDAINWFFENENEGIILEDDCLPDISFFLFQSKMLEKFRSDKRVYMVSGYNRSQSWLHEKYDYFFSSLGGSWGWGTWRDRWKESFDKDAALEEIKTGSRLRSIFSDETAIRRSEQLTKINWDYQWGLKRHMNSGLTCVPCVNLIENIGFGETATHTKCMPIQNPRALTWIDDQRDYPFLIGDADYDDTFLKLAGQLGPAKEYHLNFLRFLRRTLNSCIKKLP